MKLLSFEELRPLKGIDYSRDHLRRKIKAGEFPQPISLSEHRIAWVEAEVDGFIERLIAERDAGAR